MSRLSIDIPEHQHQRIKAMAALRGISLKDYILQAALPEAASSTAGKAEAAALAELKALLGPRIAAAESGAVSSRGMDKIIARARARRRKK